MRTAWILGWATPRTWFQSLVETVFPEDDHVYVDACDTAWEELESGEHFDSLVGYSLGSHLLLENPERASRLASRIILLAPIFAFPREEGLGGKTARAQIFYLAKWLRRDLPAALADFSSRSGLDLPSDIAIQVDLQKLEWGLRRLECGRIDPPAPQGWALYCGTGDALLDVDELMKGDSRVTRVEGGTHHPRALLEAWAAARRKKAAVPS